MVATWIGAYYREARNAQPDLEGRLCRLEQRDIETENCLERFLFILLATLFSEKFGQLVFFSPILN